MAIDRAHAIWHISGIVRLSSRVH